MQKILDHHLLDTMKWKLNLAACLILLLFSPATPQAVIKILQFEKSTGIIDKGENDGLRVGDVFEVNRYVDDFVYWIGRVEIIVLKPKAAGVKVVEQAVNAKIQPGDVLELRQPEEARRLEQPLAPAANNKAQDSLPVVTFQPVEQRQAPPALLRARPVLFGLASGLSQPLKNSSQALGMNFAIHVRTSDGKTQVIDMAHAYTTSLGLQAYCTLPVSKRLSVNLNYDYMPLNVKSAVEANLLNYGMRATASLMKISAAAEARVYHRWHLGLGTGLFLPQVTVNGGRQSITVSERRLGFAANTAYLLPLGPAAWVKSSLAYNIFLDNGPAIHYLTLQSGLSIGIGKP
ncbi:MAG: hypothetical protein ALAOOOJD_00191 [bacterium]|nr:hypothetical protein [bacterium]